MFKLFRTKEPDIDKCKIFCQWFYDNCIVFENCLNNSNDHQTDLFLSLNIIQNKLHTIYKNGYKGEAQFEYGYNQKDEKWELNLFHLDNDYLIKCTNLIKDNMPKEFFDKWRINICS